jgi:ABC-2 type transport system permease protein
LILVIPNDFNRKLFDSKDIPQVQVLIDGVDGNTATIIKNYVDAAVLSFNNRFQSGILSRNGAKYAAPLDLRPVFWYNPDLDTTKFLIPGLIAMILIITATITVSMSLVREKEKGTIEQINVSSIKIVELLFGKSLPYLIIALINAGFILIAGFVLFGVIVKGSFLLLVLSILIFLSSAIALGIFISVLADTQQVAFSAATFATLLPSFILSGFVFPINNMPVVIQVFTNITPVKFFIVALRGIILKGVGLEAFWTQWLYLLLFTLVFLTLAAVVQKKKEMKA